MSALPRKRRLNVTLTGSREICDILGMADSLAKPLESDKSAAKAEPAVRAIAMPADTNSHGDIFGGWLLCQMDLAGGTIDAVWNFIVR